MTKLHVFVNSEGKVVATGPAPAAPADRKSEAGPIFAGFYPANESDGITGYEMDVDDDVTSEREDARVGEFHARLSELVRARRGNLKQVSAPR